MTTITGQNNVNKTNDVVNLYMVLNVDIEISMSKRLTDNYVFVHQFSQNNPVILISEVFNRTIILHMYVFCRVRIFILMCRSLSTGLAKNSFFSLKNSFF